MTYAEACQYAAEVRLRRNQCGDCPACTAKAIEATVKQITNAIYAKPLQAFSQILKSAVQPMPA